MTRTFVRLALSLSIFACASPPPAPAPKPVVAAEVPSEFPPASEVDSLGTMPDRGRIPQKFAAPAEWTLSTPLPDAVDFSPKKTAKGAFEIALAKFVSAGGRTRLTEQMSCVARQLGQFQLKHGALPGMSLQAFIVHRCGSTASDVKVSLLSELSQQPVPENVVFGRWGPKFDALLATIERGRPGEVGTWFGHDDGRTAVILVRGARRVEIRPLPMTLEGNVLQISGRTLERFDTIQAFTNRGELGTEECVRGRGAASPRFAFECEVSSGELSARVELVGTLENRVHRVPLLSLELWPRAEASAAFTRPEPIDHLIGTKDLRLQIAEVIGAVRDRSGLRKLTFERAQSETATKMTPGFFAELFHPKDGLTSRRLGLRAGWEVSENVRFGSVVHGWHGKLGGAPQLVAELLESPFARSVLLDSNAHRLAVGAFTATDRPFTGVVVATYETFEAGKKDDLALAFDRINDLRARHGVAGAIVVPEMQPVLQEYAAKVTTRELSSEEALEKMISNSSRAASTGVEGWSFEVARLRDLDPPREVVQNARVQLAVGVAHTKNTNDPWGRYRVFIVRVVGRGP